MEITLEWEGEHRFAAATGSGIAVMVDGDGETGASPMESVLIALGGCMGIDVVDILRKGRQEVTGCEIRVRGERREEPPRRFTEIELTVALTGRGLTRSRAERAVELSRETYCSVVHSLAPDTGLSFEVELREA
ncbi:MAG: OsmC family protein [Gemmatimonadota bacterium]|nr:OsmC family protein [Gemmatimonadota bacterium]